MADSNRKILFEDKVQRLAWDPGTGVIESIALCPMSSPEFRAALERLLVVLRDKRAPKCLADLTLIQTISPEDLLWCETDYWPRCLATGVSVFAMVIPKSLAAHILLDKAFQKWETSTTGQVSAFFRDAESAREWIAQQRAPLPGKKSTTP